MAIWNWDGGRAEAVEVVGWSLFPFCGKKALSYLFVICKKCVVSVFQVRALRRVRRDNPLVGHGGKESCGLPCHDFNSKENKSCFAHLFCLLLAIGIYHLSLSLDVAFFGASCFLLI